MPDPDDRVSAALAGIKALITRRDHLLARMNAAPFDDAGSREMEERFTAAQDKLAARVPRLAAAVEAALKHHVPRTKYHAEGDSFRFCSTCPGHPPWPCPEVRDVTAELAGTGKEAGDE